jgi:hypothetical protein
MIKVCVQVQGDLDASKFLDDVIDVLNAFHLGIL